MPENQYSTKKIKHEILQQFAKRLFRKIGLNESDSVSAAHVLIAADLRGVDSHGIARLSGYVRLFEQGRIKPDAHPEVIHETATTATVDGNSGLGLVIAPFAMELAMKKAREYGSGWVSVCNSSHFGIAGYHAMLATKADMIGIAMTNASPLVAPTFSVERMLGTNPMAFAFPAGNYPPVVVDMATAAAANGKLEIAERAKKIIPQGWVQTSAGQPSSDPDELKNGGSLLPLGSDRDHGSHKGFGLSATVDILSAVLSGANFGPWVPPFVSFLDPPSDPVGKGIGHFFGALRIDGFRPAQEFKQQMDTWIERFKQAIPADPEQGVIIPGEPEAEAEKVRLAEGIPVPEMLLEELNRLAARYDLSL